MYLLYASILYTLYFLGSPLSGFFKVLSAPKDRNPP